MAANPEPSKPAVGEPRDAGARRNAHAGRTALIIGGIALAFYIASLVQGHRGDLNSSWEPTPAPGASAKAMPAQTPVAAPHRTGASGGRSASPHS